MTNNFIEYPNPSLGYPKLITQTILANTAVTDTPKATIFIIIIPILSPKSHLLLLYHQICVLNLRRRKLPLSLCARLEDRRCTHTVQKLIRIWSITDYSEELTYTLYKSHLLCCVGLLWNMKLHHFWMQALQNERHMPFTSVAPNISVKVYLLFTRRILTSVFAILGVLYLQYLVF